MHIQSKLIIPIVIREEYAQREELGTYGLQVATGDLDHHPSLTHTAKFQPRLSEATIAGSRLDGPENVGKEF